MSKPDAVSGSLESILASIRKSLSEQSTDALSETSTAPANDDRDMRPARKGLAQRLAGAAAKPSPNDALHANDDLSDLLEPPASDPVPAPSPAPAAAPDPAAAAAEEPGAKDPLWFLTRRRDEPTPEAQSPPLAEAPEPSSQPPAAEPKLTRPEVLRASMPPFFGSSAEAAKPAPTPGDAPPATPAAPAAPVARTEADASIAREVSLLAEAAEAAAARPAQIPPQPALNGTGSPVSAAPAPEAGTAGDTPHTNALEVMVLELLRPMLRQWLDENMPRLVAEALSEEVQRTRAAKGDVKKT